jgi:hypothetical protein
MSDRLQSTLIAHGALVFLVGMVAGFPFAFVLLQKVALGPLPALAWTPPGDVRAWRMAHLEGILNGLTLIGVAAAGPRIALGARAQAWVVWGLIVTAWGNIVASVIGPIFGVRGLELGDGLANSLMYLLFVIAIVAVMVAMTLVARGAFAAARGAADE